VETILIFFIKLFLVPFIILAHGVCFWAGYLIVKRSIYERIRMSKRASDALWKNDLPLWSKALEDGWQDCERVTPRRSRRLQGR
jgi:hypothetical protein